MKKWLVLFFGIVCIAISAIFVKLANINGLVSALYRILVALLFLSAFRIFVKNKPVPNKYKLITIFAGVFFGFELACWNVAIMKSSASMPTLLVNLSSVWVCIGAFIFLKEKVTIFHWIGNIVALLGLIIIIGINQLLKLKFESGILLSISASAFLAVYILLIKKVRSKMDTLSVLFYALIGSAIPLLFICIGRGLPLVGYPKISYAYLIALGLITQLGGYFSINYALGHIASIKVSLITLLQPVLTTIFAWIILNETIPNMKLIGGAIVLIGISISFIKLDNAWLKFKKN